MSKQSFEDVVVRDIHFRRISDKIKAYIDRLLPEHINHTIRIYYDGIYLVWARCLDCDMLWDHCDFCKVSNFPEFRGAKRLLDFECVKCKRGVKP